MQIFPSDEAERKALSEAVIATGGHMEQRQDGPMVDGTRSTVWYVQTGEGEIALIPGDEIVEDGAGRWFVAKGGVFTDGAPKPAAKRTAKPKA